MKTYKIVVLSGDGIGPEIVEGALEVLEKVKELSGNYGLDFDFHKAGAALYLESGENISGVDYVCSVPRGISPWSTAAMNRRSRSTPTRSRSSEAA